MNIDRVYSRHWGHGCVFWGHIFLKKGHLLSCHPLAKEMSVLKISNENIFSKIQGTKLGGIIESILDL